MKRSTERILTTHTGSLPRPDDLAEMMLAREEGRAVDEPALAARVRTAVQEVVQRQVAIGLDVVNDGEASKPSYVNYVKDRLAGFGGESRPRQPGADRADFPEFFAGQDALRSLRAVRLPVCDGPVAVRDTQAVHEDIARLKAALADLEPTDVFVTAISPGTVTRWLANTYYPSHEAYLYTLADAMKYEYRAIADAGFVLQVDCPDLAGARDAQLAGAATDETRKRVALHVEVLNYALEGLPEDQLRMHLCWGNYPGPHNRDVALKDIIDIILSARPMAVSYEAANPRHAHEWKLFEDVQLPEDKILIPGVIESCSPYIEHPELVAQRIVQLARLVGRENVIAGTDCGFGTFITQVPVDPRIAWAKIESMVEGARLASAELW